jgi:hypothetical protein
VPLLLLLLCRFNEEFNQLVGQKHKPEDADRLADLASRSVLASTLYHCCCCCCCCCGRFNEEINQLVKQKHKDVDRLADLASHNVLS